MERAFSFSSFPAIVPFYLTAEKSLRLQANQTFGNNGGQHSVSWEMLWSNPNLTFVQVVHYGSLSVLLIVQLLPEHKPSSNSTACKAPSHLQVKSKLLSTYPAMTRTLAASLASPLSFSALHWFVCLWNTKQQLVPTRDHDASLFHHLLILVCPAWNGILAP